MNYSNLYINGCSFTKGHHLSDKDTWPVKLSQTLGLELYNHAENGQSMQSIAFNTFMHLRHFDPKDTLVVIGLTWPPRYMVQWKDMTFNMTPTDITALVNQAEAKVQRCGFPYFYDLEIEDRIEYRLKIVEELPHDKTISNFLQFQHSQIDSQSSYELRRNEVANYIYTVSTLSSFLKEKGFNFEFVLFPATDQLEINEEDFSLAMDYTNTIKMFNHHKYYIQADESHPSADGCTYIADLIAGKIWTDS